QRPRALVPLRALEDPGLALEPAAVGLFDVLAARREDVEDEAAAGAEEAAGGAECAEALGVAAEVEERAERAGDELDALGDGRIAQVAEPEVQLRRDAGEVGALAADLEHPGRRVDADHADAVGGDRDRDPAGADAKLHDRP